MKTINQTSPQNAGLVFDRPGITEVINVQNRFTAAAKKAFAQSKKYKLLAEVEKMLNTVTGSDIPDVNTDKSLLLLSSIKEALEIGLKYSAATWRSTNKILLTTADIAVLNEIFEIQLLNTSNQLQSFKRIMAHISEVISQSSMPLFKTRAKMLHDILTGYVVNYEQKLFINLND